MSVRVTYTYSSRKPYLRHDSLIREAGREPPTAYAVWPRGVGMRPARRRRQRAERYRDRYPWLNDHDHTEGPWCFVLENVRRLPKPIPYRGRQLWFPVSNELIGLPETSESNWLEGKT